MHKRYRSSLAQLLTIAISLILLAGCTDSLGEKEPGFLENAALTHPDAVKTYRNRCISCHGTELQGRSGPALSTIGEQYTEEELFSIIMDGRTSRGMPAYKRLLEEAQIQELAVWLSSQANTNTQTKQP